MKRGLSSGRLGSLEICHKDSKALLVFTFGKKPTPMPKIYEYLGISIFFFSNEHEPIHVHGLYGEFESKAEIFWIEKNVLKVEIIEISGKRSLKGKTLKNFEIFINEYAVEIMEKWNLYFKQGITKLTFERITKKIR